MSGKIKPNVRLGISKDPKYDKYPEIYWEIRGEDNVKTTLSPSYYDVEKLLLAFRRHELKVDATRERKRYISKFIRFLEKTLEKVKQMELTNEIEPIYYEPKRIK